MRTAVALLLLVGLRAVSCSAAFTDFSDYTQSTTFSIGQAFESQGVSFRAVGFKSLPNPVMVFGALLPGPGVEFVLPAGIREISFSYNDGAAARFAINGSEPQYVANRAGFSHFDNMSLAGVSIDARVLWQNTGMHNGQLTVSAETGLLTLRGPIDSFTIAGLELSIDNVLVRVPEPASCALLVIAATAVVRRRGRR